MPWSPRCSGRFVSGLQQGIGVILGSSFRGEGPGFPVAATQNAATQKVDEMPKLNKYSHLVRTDFKN